MPLTIPLYRIFASLPYGGVHEELGTVQMHYPFENAHSAVPDDVGKEWNEKEVALVVANVMSRYMRIIVLPKISRWTRLWMDNCWLALLVLA
jgi:hypothetical protein